MSIHAALTRRTRHSYDRLVHPSPQISRLSPAPYGRTPMLAYSLRVSPGRRAVPSRQHPGTLDLRRAAMPEGRAG